ncbi:MAG: MFS transporter [Opitutaceae bacterium]|nr:MFS transporter [Opitutaceae bacterium]
MPLTDPAEINSRYRYWRTRILYASFFGYAVYYFCRVNISMAIPQMQSDLGYSKSQIGLIVSGLQLAYGLGKFANGILADRANPRYFMALGLLLSGVVNIVFGLSASLVVLMVLWAANGWFQSMGFPPGARLLSHWYSPTEYGRIWGIYGCSHQVGAAIVLVVVGYLVQFGWKTAFVVPGILAIAVALLLVERLRDIPASLGLPPVELHRKDVIDPTRIAAIERPLSIRETLLELVLNNRAIWYIAFGNLFLYVARYGALTWAPTFIKEAKGVQLSTAGWMMALFEVLGIAGMLSAGWVSDRVFRTRRGPVMAVYMLGATLAMLVFWLAPASLPWVFGLALGACGFFIYGPLMLVSVAATGFAGKKAAATASGFTGLWGYAGAVISGVGIGWVAQHHGWGAGFVVLAASGVLSAACFALTWNVGARGVETRA